MSVDAQMASEVTGLDGFPSWDFYEVDGIVPFIEGETGDRQTANLCAFIDKDSCPQLLNTGVPWSQYTNNEATFGAVDSAIRSNLNSLSLSYQPDYTVANNKVTCKVVKIQ